MLKCSGAEKGYLFLKRVYMDVDLAIEGEVADDDDVLFLECDCEGFIESNNLCVHALLVAEDLGLCDIKALSGSCGAGRQGPGRKRAPPKALSKDARVGGVPSTHTAKHWIGQFLVRKPGYWMKSHVARKFGDGGTEFAGEVVGTTRGDSRKTLKAVTVSWEHVPDGFSKTEELKLPAVAAALALAAELGVAAVAD